MKTIRKLICLLTLMIMFILPLNAYAYTYNIVFQNTPPSLLDWGRPVPYWAGITSKWNQPRDTGTNPHQGVDVGVDYGTEVYAVWNGWLTYLGQDSNGYNMGFLIDANNNGIQDDPSLLPLTRIKPTMRRFIPSKSSQAIS